ncbi:hypothetical protein E4T47_07006 [Aureobasidium subglaciale]|nr:hypothetical protein E4T43_09057 [Aureobasidium subglaciale]KAI5269514.1 hypothetical protein E4T47_07006 [Aureobasidium subglaciale]
MQPAPHESALGAEQTLPVTRLTRTLQDAYNSLTQAEDDASASSWLDTDIFDASTSSFLTIFQRSLVLTAN